MRALALAIAIALSAAGLGQGTPAQRADPDRAVVWAVGDAGWQSPATRRLAATVRRDSPDRLLYLGDVYELGTAEDFQRNYDPLWGPLAPITDPTPGNHDWGNRFSGYYPYWRARRGRRQPPWSRVELAGWEILDLNSQAAHDPGSPQLSWLTRALRGPGECRIAFWHRPRFSAGVHGDQPDTAPLYRALAGRARVVIGGHDHNLQRMRRRGGIRQYVAGAGGRNRYRIDRGDPGLAWGRDDTEGALRIVLRPGRALLEFRDADGRVLDRSHASCEPQ